MIASAELTSTQKAAALLIAMGKEKAAKIIVQCDADEVRALMAASESLKEISEPLLETVVDEFEAACGVSSGALESGGALQDIIDEALTPEQKVALSIGPKAAEMALRNATIWELLEKLKQEDLIDFLLNENQQVSAYVLSRLPSKKSAEIVSVLEPEARQNILAAMMTSRSAIPEAIKMLEDILKEKFSRSLGVTQDSGGNKRLAGMFNELDSDLSDNLFDELAEVVEPQSLQKVKSLMFRFEDIPMLDKADIAKIVDEVATEVLTMALRTAESELLELILGAMGQRTRRMMESELATPSSETPEDIKNAQKEVASIVLNLSSSGAIKIPEPDLAA